jgi:hypothetical protein
VDRSAAAQQILPRIVPIPARIKALEGEWALEGRIVRLYQEADSGVLLALNHEGQHVNPLKVISKGKKLGREKPREIRSTY